MFTLPSSLFLGEYLTKRLTKHLKLKVGDGGRQWL
jgi:hypothetical protein